LKPLTSESLHRGQRGLVPLAGIGRLMTSGVASTTRGSGITVGGVPGLKVVGLAWMTMLFLRNGRSGRIGVAGRLAACNAIPIGFRTITNQSLKLCQDSFQTFRMVFNPKFFSCTFANMSCPSLPNLFERTIVRRKAHSSTPEVRLLWHGCSRISTSKYGVLAA
jgi:hypothetical protein